MKKIYQGSVLNSNRGDIVLFCRRVKTEFEFGFLIDLVDLKFWRGNVEIRWL